jgi:hypothetical protein
MPFITRALFHWDRAFRLGYQLKTVLSKGHRADLRKKPGAVNILRRRLVRKAARRIYRLVPEPVSFGDLHSAGFAGLVGALDKFGLKASVSQRHSCVAVWFSAESQQRKPQNQTTLDGQGKIRCWRRRATPPLLRLTLAHLPSPPAANPRRLSSSELDQVAVKTPQQSLATEYRESGYTANLKCSRLFGFQSRSGRTTGAFFRRKPESELLIFQTPT